MDPPSGLADVDARQVLGGGGRLPKCAYPHACARVSDDPLDGVLPPGAAERDTHRKWQGEEPSRTDSMGEPGVE